MPVQEEKGFHCGVAGTFIPIHKRMILNEREGKSGCFLDGGRIKVFPAKCHLWLSQGRFQSAEVSNAHRTTRLLYDPMIELEDFAQPEIAH